MSLFVTDEVHTFAHTARPRSCPWGVIQHVKERAPGIWEVSTPSHGGFLISAERRAAMPAPLRDVQTFTGGNAYEEDMDVCLVIAAFPECFPDADHASVRESIAAYDREPRDDYERARPYYATMRKAAQFIKQSA